MMLTQKVNDLFCQQLADWELARQNFEGLKQVMVKTLEVDGIPFKIQFNPARITSSAAKTDAKSVQERKCFLCKANRPKEQVGIPFQEHYEILLNPFPIFSKHLTIVDTRHIQQSIMGRMEALLDLSKELPDYTFFYNGPKCGASAPDHAHFQGGEKGFMPLETTWRSQVKEPVFSTKYGSIYVSSDAPSKFFLFKSSDRDKIIGWFDALYYILKNNDEEPMMNILAMYEENEWYLFVFPRTIHRPQCYFEVGEKRLLSSPASVDMGEAFILPLREDFEKITSEKLKGILSEVSPTVEKMDSMRNLLIANIKNR